MTRTLLILLALAAPLAHAQVTTEASPEPFDAADRNKDGYVDRSEYDSFVIEQVLIYDTDDDGRISRAEAEDPKAAARFDKVDANGDGYCSMEEVEAWSAADFNYMDADGDGRISRTEATAAAERGN
jgi:hypothetical protein